MIKLFIDGQEGTTGLQILDRLKNRDEFEIMYLDNDIRKDIKARSEMLNGSDISILCLPEGAAREAVGLIDNNQTKVIDASIAHRVDPEWVYGFPEYKPDQREVIADSKRVTNPGCYACASIAIIYPLVKLGILPADFPVTINAVSGYTGGGKSLIRSFEDKTSEDYTNQQFFLYGLSLTHKHVPEIKIRGELEYSPIFIPSVGRFARGMLVSIPLHLRLLEGQPNGDDVYSALANYYEKSTFVEVVRKSELSSISRIDPMGTNDTNLLKIHVFSNEHEGLAFICVLLDNLGKGASGQAIQNLNLMAGLDESTGLF